MAETHTPPITIPNSAEDNGHISPSQFDAASDAEHEDSGDHSTPVDASNGNSRIEGLKPSISQETQAADTHTQTSPAKGANSSTAVKNKGTMSVEPPKKANGSPPTPTVKKIINSGTFGAGSVKATVTKGTTSTTSSASKVAAPAMKKTTTSAPGAASKPTLASSVSSKPSVTPAASTRRASVVPTKTAAPPQVRPSLSASASGKPSESGPVRNSVTSPTGSVGSVKAAPAIPAARPRASVSEAVKKPPLSSRPSVTGSSRTAVPAKTTTVSRSSAAAPPAKSSRPTSSISSIKEIKEDGKALEEAQAQLSEAAKSLEEKSAVVSDLESQVENLAQSLAQALEGLESKTASITEAEKAREAAESELHETQSTLLKAQEDLQQVTETLRSIQIELDTARSSTSTQNDTVQQLEIRIQEVEAALSSSKEQVELLKKNNAEAAKAAEAASVEHDALSQAQADIKAISEEMDALKAGHTKALQGSEGRISQLREQLAATEALQEQVSSLKAEKEENANKLSELEVEILELKETQESLEDTQAKLRQQISTLDDELAKAAASKHMAAEAASQKEAAHSTQLEEIAQQHIQELEAASARYAEVSTALENLKMQHKEAVATKEQAEKEVAAKEQEHASALVDLEQAHAAQQAALAADIEKISKQLQDQETIYNAKVDAVKSEHSQLLQEAFERAKDEAAQAHSQELQTLRSSSNATIEQIQEANQVAMNALKAEHESSLENEVNGLKKQINKLSLELKATQDDLAKAKTSLEASHTEVISLTQQRDAARAQAEAVPALSPEHADEIARLTRELSNSKDDLAAVTDMLNLTKSSMTELSEKQTKELEEAAKARADEVLKLRSAHDFEINELAEQKSALLVKLSDLQGELATAKATLDGQQGATPKSNGNGVIQSPASPGVTKEELTKMHEAHNLKIYDLQADHEKVVKLANDQLEEALTKIGELQQDLARKAMEIQYLEQDQDENQEHITRLKEDLERLSQEKS